MKQHGPVATVLFGAVIGYVGAMHGLSLWAAIGVAVMLTGMGIVLWKSRIF